MNLDDLEPKLRRRIQEQIEKDNAEYLARRLRTEKPESDGRGEGQNSPLEESPPSVGYRITITSYRTRLLDERDNKASAAKQLADIITEWLGFSSDDHPRLEWHDHQIKSKTHGTHVLIEQV